MLDATLNGARANLIAVGTIGGVIHPLPVVGEVSDRPLSRVVISVGVDLLLAGINDIIQPPFPQSRFRSFDPLPTLVFILEGDLCDGFEVLVGVKPVHALDRLRKMFTHQFPNPTSPETEITYNDSLSLIGSQLEIEEVSDSIIPEGSHSRWRFNLKATFSDNRFERTVYVGDMLEFDEYRIRIHYVDSDFMYLSISSQNNTNRTYAKQQKHS